MSGEERLGWIGVGRMGQRWPPGCSRRATTSASTTARALRQSRSPSSARRSSTARRARRPRHRVHDGRRQRGRRGGGLRPAGPALARGRGPGLIIDATTISPATAAGIRAAAELRGTRDAGRAGERQPKVAASGRLTIVASGPREAWVQARPFLELLGRSVTYVGEGDGRGW